jgi:hypothetical protein
MKAIWSKLDLGRKVQRLLRSALRNAKRIQNWPLLFLRRLRPRVLHLLRHLRAILDVELRVGEVVCGLLLVLRVPARLGWSMLLRYLHRMLLMELSWISAYTYRHIVLRELGGSWSWRAGYGIRVLSIGWSLVEAHASTMSKLFSLIVD